VAIPDVLEQAFPISEATGIRIRIGTISFRVGRHPLVAEIATEQFRRIVDQRASLVRRTADVGQIVPRDFAGFAAVPVIGLARI
jgi:hypothetical protein